MIKHFFLIPTRSCTRNYYCSGRQAGHQLQPVESAGKALFTTIVEEFKKQNPDLEVAFNTTDHEGYKTAIRNWLTTEPPDIVFWFSGNRMKAFVDRGLFDDVSDLWQKNNWNEEFKTTAFGDDRRR